MFNRCLLEVIEFKFKTLTDYSFIAWETLLNRLTSSSYSDLITSRHSDSVKNILKQMSVQHQGIFLILVGVTSRRSIPWRSQQELPNLPKCLSNMYLVVIFNINTLVQTKVMQRFSSVTLPTPGVSLILDRQQITIFHLELRHKFRLVY